MRQLLIISIIMLCVSTHITAVGQTKSNTAATAPKDEAYMQNMQQTLKVLDRTTDVDGMLQVVNALQQISADQPSEWLPPYYLAYVYTTLTFMQQSASPALRTGYLDEAQTQLDIAQDIVSEEDKAMQAELAALQAYLYQMRIEVAPTDTSNLAIFGTLLPLAMERAQTLDPDNPRVYYLQAQTLFFNPKAIGSNTADYCPLIEKAALKYALHELRSTIHPNWGIAMTSFMRGLCQAQEGQTTTQPTPPKK